MIRFATENDLEAILVIYNDAIVNTTAVYTYKAKTLEERVLWFQTKQKEGYPLWVYEHDGKVVGYATYGSFRSSPAYKYTIEHSVYVHKDFRKHGFGKALLETIIEDANTKGYATIVAGIDAANIKSIHLHEKFGFVLSGIVHKAGYKFAQWLDLAFYELQLDGPKNPTEG